jgi:hypothetical protein
VGLAGVLLAARLSPAAEARPPGATAPGQVLRYEVRGGYLNLPGLTGHDPSPPPADRA